MNKELRLPNRPLSEMTTNEQVEELCTEPMTGPCGAGKEDAMNPFTKEEWPTRDEWAKERRTLYFDMFDGIGQPFTCTPAEVQTITVRLRTEWSRLGKELKAAKRRCPEAVRRPGEHNAEYCSRYYALTEEQKRPWDAVQLIIEYRQMLLECVKALRESEWPRHRYGFIDEAIAVPLHRSEEAREAAINLREQEILSTPIDDEAWEKELRRRKEYEELCTENFIHRC